MATTADPQTVTSTSKGQMVIPAKLRRHYKIAAGIQVVVTDTKEGILLKPITTGYIRSLRDSMKGKGVLKALAKDKKATRVTGDVEFKSLEKEIKIHWLK